MSIIYSVSSDTSNGLVDETLLSQEIIASGIAVPSPGLVNLNKVETLGDVLTITHVPSLDIIESGILTLVVAVHSGSVLIAGIDTPGPDDSLALHTGDPSAHHARYTDGEAAAVAATLIVIHAGDSSAHHARYTNAEASGVAVQVATTGIAQHTAIVDAHHTRYTDAEAIAASSGVLDHHVRYTDVEASGVAVQVVTTGIAQHAAIVDAHHIRYTDTEASGVAVAVVITGILEHTNISGAHHARYTDAEAIAAASGALDHHARYTDAEASGVAVQVVITGILEHTNIPGAHHARYTDAEASGVAVQVVITGILEHTNISGAHHTRYTDAEAIIAATGNVTLQTAYDAGSIPPHIISSFIKGPLTFQSNSIDETILRLRDSTGTIQHQWNRSTIFMGPDVGNIVSASLSGINLSPALFPDRPTVNFTLDQLNILPSDRTITSNFVKIRFSNTYTLDFPAASFGAALGLNATILLRQAGGPFGMGLLFNNAITWSNDSGFAVNLGSAFSFVDQPFYRADGATITQPVVRSMISQPRFIVTGGGDLTLGTLQHYFAGGAINLGAHIGERIAFDCFNPAPFTGEITGSHIALKIANLTDGGGGATIRGVQSSMNNGLFIEQLGTAPSEHLSEFRIGSTLAHIGDTDTNIGFVTNTFNINVSGINTFRTSANGVLNFVSVNPTLLDIDFFVNGSSTTLIRTNAGIDGIGFFGAPAVAQSGNYVTSNFTLSRTLNGSGITLNQVVNVLATLIEDFKSLGPIG